MSELHSLMATRSHSTRGGQSPMCLWQALSSFYFILFFFVFCLFVVVVAVVAISWAAPAAYGGSQARG